MGTVGWHSYLQFQLTAARRRLEKYEAVVGHRDVSTHSRPKAAGSGTLIIQLGISPFQLTAARRRLVKFRDGWLRPCRVSTHSRPKAAGHSVSRHSLFPLVSTHSRPKAAGCFCREFSLNFFVSTHSRPKAAGYVLIAVAVHCLVSTHSRPKAAGVIIWILLCIFIGFNSQPPEGGWSADCDKVGCHKSFQLTAARRRLVLHHNRLHQTPNVSTHSRPKAAGRELAYRAGRVVVSTHSRPKAAGVFIDWISFTFHVSTHSRPKAAGT